MITYADYIFYKESHFGVLSEEEFDRHLVRATAFVRRITFGRADDGVDLEEIKHATCAVVDIYAGDYNNRKKHNGKSVASENNDGYSVSFVQEQKTGETMQEVIDRKAYSEAAVYLAPTGMMYMGVDET